MTIIREKNKATGGLTDQEKVLMKEHSELWIKRILRTEPIEPEKIIPAIEGLYEVSGLKKPKVIIVPSPLVMAFAYGAASSILSGKFTYAATDVATYDATRAATDVATRAATVAATYAATNDATDVATRAATGAATDVATYDATRAATRAVAYAATDAATGAVAYAATDAATGAATDAAKACFELSGIEGLKIAKRWTDLYQGGNMWGSYDSYLTAFRDVLGLELEIYDKYHYWEQCAIHGGFRVMHPEFCMVSDFPEFIKMDDQNRPHCENGPSHRWRDGWSLYYWHGVSVPREWIEEKDKLTAKIAITWDNIEQRRAACEIVGWNKILEELNARVIDTDGDPQIGQLLEVDIPEIGTEKFLRVLCGTGRLFALPVPPEMKTALEAQAWTWGMDANEFMPPEIRT